jgi:glycosyl-4,4'-diaponeurosporenoate acyltransferase
MLIVVADAAVWAGWSALVGYAAHRMPVARLERDGWLTRLRRFEADGHVYERLGVRRWKDRLPELGDAFRGGVSKRRLPGRDVAALACFAAETRRAELVHWAIPAVLPVFAWWNPPGLFAAMAAYAVLANAPCVVVQRYNRGRLARIIDRDAEARATRSRREHPVVTR